MEVAIVMVAEIFADRCRITVQKKQNYFEFACFLHSSVVFYVGIDARVGMRMVVLFLGVLDYWVADNMMQGFSLASTFD